MRANYDLEKLKVKRRGPLLGLAGEDAKTAKVRVTIALDADVVEHFKAEAAKPGGLPYQTQINQALRHMLDEPTDIDTIKNTLLHDPEFVRELAQQLARD